MLTFAQQFPERPIAIFARQLLRTNSPSDQPDEDQYV
jgi:hypothetical protein